MSDSPEVTLKEKVRRLPDKPGVYLMKDRLGRIIYVGKAKSLKKRVSSYFQRGRARTISQPKIRALIELIADLDTIEVKSEPEALLLEGKLIKQWRPRYNTDFTDDKRFLLVRLPLGLHPCFRLYLELLLRRTGSCRQRSLCDSSSCHLLPMSESEVGLR